MLRWDFLTDENNAGRGVIGETREAGGNFGVAAQAAATGTLQATSELSNTAVRAATEVLVSVVEGMKEVLAALMPKPAAGVPGADAEPVSVTSPSSEESSTRRRPPSGRRTEETSE